MRRWVAVVLIVCLLAAAVPPPAVAAAGLIPLPGPEAAEWDILISVLRTILALRLDGGEGLKVLMGEVYTHLDRGFPDPLQFNLLARLKQTFDGIQSLRNEVQKLACNWRFSKRTFTLKRLYLEPLDICKAESDSIWGAVPRGMPDGDFQDLLGYVVTNSQNLASSRMEASQDWATHFGTMYRRSSDVRRSPGEAIRDDAHNRATKVAVDSSNAQVLTQDLLVRQMEDAFERAEVRRVSVVSASIYHDLAGVPVRFVEAPPYEPPPAEPPQAPEPGDGNGGEDAGGDCSRTRPNFLGQVQSAISLTAQRHPEWLANQGSDGREHPGPQTYIAGEFWDAYYGDVVANINAAGLRARVDPCMCGEIQVKQGGGFSDQYHILTSWGQVRTDQNAYRDTCSPEVF